MRILEEFEGTKIKVIIKSLDSNTFTFKLIDTTLEEVFSFVTQEVTSWNLSPIKQGNMTSITLQELNEKEVKVASSTISFYNCKAFDAYKWLTHSIDGTPTN